MQEEGKRFEIKPLEIYVFPMLCCRYGLEDWQKQMKEKFLSKTWLSA